MDNDKEKSMWQDLIQLMTSTIADNKNMAIMGCIIGIIFGAIISVIAPNLWYLPWIILVLQLHIFIKLAKKNGDL